jgi:hypothetical protein
MRREAGNGRSERAIQRKHHVGRRAIVKALGSADPPERKKIYREPAALDGVSIQVSLPGFESTVDLRWLRSRLRLGQGVLVAVGEGCGDDGWRVRGCA